MWQKWCSFGTLGCPRTTFAFISSYFCGHLSNATPTLTLPAARFCSIHTIPQTGLHLLPVSDLVLRKVRAVDFHSSLSENNCLLLRLLPPLTDSRLMRVNQNKKLLRHETQAMKLKTLNAPQRETAELGWRLSVGSSQTLLNDQLSIWEYCSEQLLVLHFNRSLGILVSVLNGRWTVFT